MVRIDLFVAFIPNVLNPFIWNSLVVRIYVILINQETKNVQYVHQKNYFFPFKFGLGVEVL